MTPAATHTPQPARCGGLPALTLRPYQHTLRDDAGAAFNQGHRQVLAVAPTGAGKCLGKGTPVLMYSGATKNVEDVQCGDLLMGPDSQPRRAVSVCRGAEMLYRVTPTKGDPYVVNESHILSLKRTNEKSEGHQPWARRGGEVVNIPVFEYIEKSKWFKHIHKGWRAAVDFETGDATLPLEPYFMGAWLGDGSSRNANVTTGDPEVKQYLCDYAAKLGMDIRLEFNSEGSDFVHLIAPNGGQGPNTNPITLALRQFGVRLNKHIPLEYKTSSRANRLALLAGIIDTDGSYDGKGFDLCLKSERLLDDVIFVARSLGFSCYKSAAQKKCHNNGAIGTYYRCSIHGPVDQVPCLIERKKAAPRKQKKNVLVTGIHVEPIGVGEYFGFQLDGPDRLFLLGDFTVTHNTVTFIDIATRAIARQNRVCLLMHRGELIRQTSKALGDFPHGIIQAGHPPLRHLPLQIASVQTLVRRLDRYKFDLIIVDEAHHTTARTYIQILEAYPFARVLGVTATPIRTDGRGLRDAGYTAMVQGPTVRWLTDAGYLSPAHVYAPGGIDVAGVKTTAGEFNRGQLAAVTDRPVITGNAIEHYRRYADRQPAIAFCVSVEHAEHVAELFRYAGYSAASIDGKKSDHERARLIGALGTGELNVLTSCDLISEGVDVPVVACGIMLRPTQSKALWMQQMGRCLRPAPGKTHAVILDHAGNSRRLECLPDTEHEWSLDAPAAKRAADPDPDAVTVRVCAECLRSHVARPVCPFCGYVYPLQSRTVDEVAGELELLDAAYEAAGVKQTKLMQEIACRSEAELVALGKARGYQYPAKWAAYRWQHSRAKKDLDRQQQELQSA